MNYKLLSIVLLAVTGLLSCVIVYLIINMRAMVKAMDNYTHNRKVMKMTKSLREENEELKLDNEELLRKIDFLEGEIARRNPYIDAYANCKESYDKACDTLYNLFHNGLLIKNITCRWLFDDLVSKGYVEVYNPKRDFDVTVEEVIQIFGANIFQEEDEQMAY